MPKTEKPATETQTLAADARRLAERIQTEVPPTPRWHKLVTELEALAEESDDE
jgi:hypothetical protein